MIVIILPKTLNNLIIFYLKTNYLFSISAAALQFMQKVITPVGQVKFLLIIKIEVFYFFVNTETITPEVCMHRTYMSFVSLLA